METKHHCIEERQGGVPNTRRCHDALLAQNTALLEALETMIVALLPGANSMTRSRAYGVARAAIAAARGEG